MRRWPKPWIPEAWPIAYYPNPSSNEVTISLPGITASTEKVEIFNAQVQHVLNIPIQEQQEDYLVNLLNAGGYLVRLTTGGKMTTKKLMIYK